MLFMAYEAKEKHRAAFPGKGPKNCGGAATTTLSAAGAVKLENPPAEGRSNFRTIRAQRPV